MERVIAFALMLLASMSSFAHTLPCEEDEELFARRIVSFWQDGEYVPARQQIARFLEVYPQSHFADHFYALLGEIAIGEKRFHDAIIAFEKVRGSELRQSVRVKRWHALYQLKLYSKLFEEIAPHASRFSDGDEEARFYYAESCFREALTLHGCEEGAQQASSLYNEALPYFENLTSSPRFGLHAKMSLAEIYRLLKRHKDAADIYLTLVDDLQKVQGVVHEETLYHAALMLTEFDQEQAMELFGRLARLGGKKSSASAGMWFYLLAKKEKWETLLEEKNLILAHLSEEKKPLFHFYVGKAFYDEQNHSEALMHLEKSLDLGLSPPHDKVSLLSLMVCANETENLSSFEKGYHLFEKRYGKESPEMGKLTFLRALCHKKADDMPTAITLLDKIIQSKGEEANGAYVEKMRLNIAEAVKVSNWNNLTGTIEEALAKEALFEKTEQQKMRILLAKGYLAQTRYQTAVSLLQDYLKRYGDHGESHALLCRCYMQIGTDPEQVVFHGERALQLNPNLQELHLPLFNNYIALAKETPKSSFDANAADHLNAALDFSPISLDNRLWLANYYYHLVKKGFEEEKAKRAIALLEPFVCEVSSFEPQLVKLATLYEWSEEYDKAFSLLKKLHCEPAQRRLANLYQLFGKKDFSFTLYKQLEDARDHSIAAEARLQVARHLFASLPAQERHEDSPHMQAIFHRLHDLKQRKSLANEPVHLEAAIEFAEYKSAVAKEEEREELLLHLLSKTKEEFTNDEDIWSKDYQASRKLQPQQDHIYQAYMRYIDARILLLQATVAKREGKILDSRSKEKAARALFSTVRQGRYAATKYLVEKTTRMQIP